MKTCSWCKGSGELGPFFDLYVCPRCRSTGTVPEDAVEDEAVVRQIEENRLGWIEEENAWRARRRYTG